MTNFAWWAQEEVGSTEEQPASNKPIRHTEIEWMDGANLLSIHTKTVEALAKAQELAEKEQEHTAAAIAQNGKLLDILQKMLGEKPE